MSNVTDDGSTFYLNVHERSFGQAHPSDDRLHRDANALIPDDPDLVETQYLGFNVPTAGIDAFNYVWAHPNLGTASGGAWAWQGENAGQLHSELFDMRNYLPISAVGELDSYILPNGYGVEVVKPLEELRITYEDASRGNAFDVTLSAFMPPAVIANGKHFEQGMRTRGSITLLGEQHTVDGFTIRDRSWGETRPEAPRLAPVVHWMTPVFGEDFAIHAFAVEDPTRKPIWDGLFEFSADRAAELSRGWVWKDGDLTYLESVTLTAEWDLTRRYPTAYRVDMVDVEDRRWSMTAELVAASNWYLWNNIYTPILLMRFECDGRSGYGDSQIGAWTDVVRRRLP
ncbi:hypothetical protein GCM10009547_28810 [Sporichthya brevicatena]|uniref:DUF7064 domain-containing protein n=1 Tax=Sporichthya brevicatena TaxID=171442 RepID=A0ABN1GYV0_9ACTN